jgi:hypothetical protein
MRTNEVRDRLAAELNIQVQTQTVAGWIKAGKLKATKLGGRYYVEWEDVLAMRHEVDSSTGSGRS